MGPCARGRCLAGALVLGSLGGLAPAFLPTLPPMRGTRALQVSRAATESEVVDTVAVDAPPRQNIRLPQDHPDEIAGWAGGLGLVPPDQIRQRITQSRGMLGKEVLAYFGDAVWEFLVLRHQYQQVSRSPFTESQAVRSLKQAKAAGVLFRGSVLTQDEKRVLLWGTSGSWRKKVASDGAAIEQVGFEQYSTALGLRTLLGYLYIDVKGSDERLEAIAREIGILAAAGEEDTLLNKVTGGLFPARPRGPTTFFLALAPLGHVALRLYISRYLAARPPRPSEFIYRVKLALRQEELDLASVGFIRDDATAEEVQLMKGAKDTEDTYAFAFECLLGHLALNTPYRLHQVVADFGWADPLPGTEQ